MAFGDRIKKARLEKGLSQEQFADIIGTKRTTYTSWERGRNEPSVENICKIAMALEVTADYLVGIPPNYEGMTGECKDLAEKIAGLTKSDRVILEKVLHAIIEKDRELNNPPAGNL